MTDYRKRPTDPGWRLVREIGPPIHPTPALVFQHRDRNLQVLSSIDSTERDFHGSGVIAPHFHVSGLHRGPLGDFTCRDDEMDWIRGQFDMGGAQEDNHGPGRVRHLWLVCGRTTEPPCPCRHDEKAVVEGDRVRHDREGE